jgi:hypothetical protein
MKRSAPLQRRAPLRAKAPPPRPAKAIDYTPRPRPAAQASRALPPAEPVSKADPVRDEAYRRLVAALPCIACGRRGRSQAAHGPALGKGIKASDLELFPLCADEPSAIGCHTKFDTYVMFDAEARRDMAAAWAAQTLARLRRG